MAGVLSSVIATASRAKQEASEVSPLATRTFRFVLKLSNTQNYYPAFVNCRKNTTIHRLCFIIQELIILRQALDGISLSSP